MEVEWDHSEMLQIVSFGPAGQYLRNNFTGALHLFSQTS
jgi:hypothetical protein